MCERLEDHHGLLPLVGDHGRLREERTIIVNFYSKKIVYNKSILFNFAAI